MPIARWMCGCIARAMNSTTGTTTAFPNCRYACVSETSIRQRRLPRSKPINRAHSSGVRRSEEHTSELQSLMRISYAVFCSKKKNYTNTTHQHTPHPLTNSHRALSVILNKYHSNLVHK